MPRSVRGFTPIARFDQASDASSTVLKEQRQVGGFKGDKRAMAVWLASLGVQLVVMESSAALVSANLIALYKALGGGWQVVDHQLVGLNGS